MIKTPWTPGPWHQDGRVIATPDKTVVATMRAQRYLLVGTEEANARLIAEAPAMAGLLQRLVALANYPPLERDVEAGRDLLKRLGVL